MIVIDFVPKKWRTFQIRCIGTHFPLIMFRVRPSSFHVNLLLRHFEYKIYEIDKDYVLGLIFCEAVYIVNSYEEVDQTVHF